MWAEKQCKLQWPLWFASMQWELLITLYFAKQCTLSQSSFERNCKRKRLEETEESRKAACETVKKRRKCLKYSHLKKDETAKKTEGVTYSAGEF